MGCNLTLPENACPQQPEWNYREFLLEKGFLVSEILILEQDLVNKFGKPITITGMSMCGAGFYFDPKTGKCKNGTGHQYKIDLKLFSKLGQHHHFFTFDKQQ